MKFFLKVFLVSFVLIVIAGLEPLGPAPDEPVAGFTGADSQAVLYATSGGNGAASRWRSPIIPTPSSPRTPT